MGSFKCFFPSLHSAPLNLSKRNHTVVGLDERNGCFGSEHNLLLMDISLDGTLWKKVQLFITADDGGWGGGGGG